MTTQENRVLRAIGENPEEGHLLLSELSSFIKRFCAFPDEDCLVAVTLWAALSHMVEHFYTTPRLAFLSVEPSSGKTRALEILDLLVPESMFVFNASPAAIFRSLDKRQVTLLFDEIDTIWSYKGKDDNHEELRALLNAGYKQGATIPRCVGSNHEVVDFRVYCAVALAGIGQLPDTIMTRSIIIKMRRRAPGEYVESFRSRQHSPAGHAFRDRLAVWALAVREKAGEAWPDLPRGVEDRNAEIWEPLLSVADAAGGDWPERARRACVALIEAASDRRVSLGIRLLDDLRILFTSAKADKLSTNYILDMLTSSNSGLADDAPWAELKGVAINARKLANILKPYGISSHKLRINDVTQWGYRLEDLHDAWQRYLSPSESDETEHPEHLASVPDVPDSQNTRGR